MTDPKKELDPALGWNCSPPYHLFKLIRFRCRRRDAPAHLYDTRKDKALLDLKPFRGFRLFRGAHLVPIPATSLCIREIRD